MSAGPARRGFLRGLVSLPLIGGGVALVGQPTAVAEPVTADLLETYKTFLDIEHRWLCYEMAGDPFIQARYRSEYRILNERSRIELSREIMRHVWLDNEAGSYHGPKHQAPSKRAALVLSAVGCDWHPH